MRCTVTKLAALAFLTLAIAGCGAGVDMRLGGARVGAGAFARDTGYYYLEDPLYDYRWYYSDGSQWWHWDDRGWAVDAGFVWRDGYDWRYYEYDPLWYDPYYDPYGSFYYDDPYYWDDVYWGDGGYYGDDWYWY